MTPPMRAAQHVGNAGVGVVDGDKRPDCKQMVVGLVINRDGFPQAHEIFDGNTQDRASLPSMLDALEARVGGFRRGQMVAVDRGMAFEENLEQLRSRGLHYLVASRQGERTRWLAEFETLKGFDEVIREPSPRNPRQKKTKVEVKLKRTEQETFVLCISDGRKQKDRATRSGWCGCCGAGARRRRSRCGRRRRRRRASGHDDDGLASRQAGAPAGGPIAIARPAAWVTFLNPEALRPSSGERS